MVMFFLLSNLGISKPGKNGYYFSNEVALVKNKTQSRARYWRMDIAECERIDKFMSKDAGAGGPLVVVTSTK